MLDLADSKVGRDWTKHHSNKVATKPSMDALEKRRLEVQSVFESSVKHVKRGESSRKKTQYTLPPVKKGGTEPSWVKRRTHKKSPLPPKETHVKKKYWGDTRSEAEKQRDAHNAPSGRAGYTKSIESQIKAKQEEKKISKSTTAPWMAERKAHGGSEPPWTQKKKRDVMAHKLPSKLEQDIKKVEEDITKVAL